MIRNEALGAWLDDRNAQLATVEGVERVARILREHPAVTALTEELDAARGGGATAVLAAADRVIGTRGFIDGVLATLVHAAADDFYYRPHLSLAKSEVHSGLELFDHPALTITLAAMSADAIAAKRAQRKGGASILFTGRRAIFRVIRSGGALLSFWKAPPIEAGFTAGASGRCALVERRRIEDGERFDVDGRRFTFIVEEATSDLVFVQAMTPLEAAPLTVEYDSQTLGFIGASSTDEASSRTQMMLSLLRIMDRRDALPIFREMLGSEHFYARWQAMRELLALDAEAGLPHLRHMAASDPHLEVRQAAAQTLAHFFPEDSCLAAEAA